MSISRRTLLSTIGLLLPVAAEAATSRKPAAKVHHVAKVHHAKPHHVAKVHAKPGKAHKVARRRHVAKPPVKQG